MELEEAIEILKRVILVNNFESYSSEGIIIEAINTVLNHLTKQEKMIELLIEDLQGEGCLNMTREEIGNYYERRIKLAEESE